MVDSLSGLGAQGYQQPITQTFEPGKNVEQRTQRETVRQQAVAQGDDFAQVEASSAQENSFSSKVSGPTENNPQAKRGELLNIVV